MKQVYRKLVDTPQLFNSILIILLCFFGISKLNAQNWTPIKYQNEKVENSKKYKKGNIYQKDLLLYINLLKETHPAFANEDPIDLKAKEKEGYKWAENCKSREELEIYLQSIASLLNDGHTGVDLDYDNDLYYPINVFIDNQKVYLFVIDTDYQSFLGKEINKINGESAIEVIKDFRKLINSDNEVNLYSKLEKRSAIFLFGRIHHTFSQTLV